MAAEQLKQVVRELKRDGERQPGGALADSELLQRFIHQHNEEAFAALVRRHGPMVLGVCRRLLRNPHDAEDAFQATFLVLVRKAHAIARRDLLGNWLYGTAYRAALETRAARRRVRERQVDHMPEPETAAGAPAPEWRAALDQELNGLPDKYRAAIVLCELEGATRRDAARQLGIPEGTLSSRLATARRLLAERLARRGVALAAGAGLTALTPDAAAPAPLMAATARAAHRWAAGEAGAASATVRAVVDGVLRGMLLKRLKSALLLLVVLAGLGCGGGLLARQALQVPPQPAAEPIALQVPPQPAAEPIAQPAQEKPRAPSAPRQLLFAAHIGRQPQIFTITLGSKEPTRLTNLPDVACYDPAWSTDGKHIVCRRASKGEVKGGYFDGICIMDADGGKLRQLTRESGADFSPSFSPDGKKVLFSMNRSAGTVLRTIDVDGSNLQELNEEFGPRINRDPAWSPDGSKIVCSRGVALNVCIMDADGGNVKQLTPRDGMQPCWSPDGKKIAYVSLRDGNGPELFVMDADGTNVKKLTPAGGPHRATGVAWSPDSKRLAYSDNGPNDWEVFVVDAGGANHRQLTRLGDSNLHCAWSPDGKELAFLHLVGGRSVPNKTTIYVMDADGRNQTEVYGFAKYLPGRVSWRPK